ncbi:MAG TPA: hypothetical protein VE780_02820 [Thermoleophilaceae bacterium]|jgi:hypothetical protein|nr:hypothetical protein [Thermoleophilaceae bacterium]
MAEQQGQPPPGGGQEPSEEELRARLEEEIKRVRVQDVLLQTVVTLVNLAGRRLTVAEEKDLEQARMGIDGVRALLPLCPEDQVGPVRDALSQLQMLYAREAKAEAAEPSPETKEQRPDEDAERAKARAKIWTPPGT